MDESFQVFLSSTNADKIGSSIGNCTWYLPFIEIPDQHHIHLSVQSAIIPVSFYNVNVSNNIISYSLSSNDSVVQQVIPVGNYNAIQLKAILNTLIPFTITYNTITNKFTFTHPTYNFTFYNIGSTCFSLLGLSLVNQVSVNKSLVSNYCANLSPIRAFQISTPTIKTGNISKSKELSQNVLMQIPINEGPNEIVSYFNATLFTSNLFVNYMHEIQIVILDQNSNVIDLNGVEWSIVLQFDILKYV